MKNEIVVTFEGDHVQAIANGDRDFDSLRRLWTTIRDICVEYDCTTVLGIAHTTKHVTTVEVMKVPGLVRELKMDTGYRIAWVELNPEAFGTTHFIETVLRNRGIYVRAFDDVEAAKEWLLDS